MHGCMKNILLPLGLIVGILSTAIIVSIIKGESTPSNEGKLQVVATFYPLAYVVERIGGPAVSVTNLTAGGLEPHEFEPTPHDVIAMQDADLLVTLGEIDGWADDIAAARRQSNKSVIIVSDSVALDDHDPHIWLDPVRLKSIVSDVQSVLVAQDPAHAGEFQHNTSVLLADLDLLDDDYQSLTSCQRDDIMVAHDAFGYLAERYDFIAHAVSSISPEAEPSARDLAALADLAKQLKINTVYFESTASPALAATLAREVGAQTGVLWTLESLTNDQLQSGEDYFSLMRQNLQTLHTELCR